VRIDIICVRKIRVRVKGEGGWEGRGGEEGMYLNMGGNLVVAEAKDIAMENTYAGCVVLFVTTTTIVYVCVYVCVCVMRVVCGWV
jgi:hypothetical protein